MKEAKKPVSFRLSNTTQTELLSLANRYDISQAQVIAVLVHLFSIHEEVSRSEAELVFEALRMG